jgi:hypothetical protein
VAKLTQKDARTGIMNCSKGTDPDTFGNVWLNCCGVIYNNNCSTVKKNVKEKVRWDGHFSQRIEIRRLEIGGVCGGKEKNRQEGCWGRGDGRATAGKDAGAPGSGRMEEYCDQGLEWGVAGDSRSSVKSWASSLWTA